MGVLGLQVWRLNSSMLDLAGGDTVGQAVGLLGRVKVGLGVLGLLVWHLNSSMLGLIGGDTGGATDGVGRGVPDSWGDLLHQGS